jgi:hypothetical protein
VVSEENHGSLQRRKSKIRDTCPLQFMSGAPGQKTQVTGLGLLRHGDCLTVVLLGEDSGCPFPPVH